MKRVNKLDTDFEKLNSKCTLNFLNEFLFKRLSVVVFVLFCFLINVIVLIQMFRPFLHLMKVNNFC